MGYEFLENRTCRRCLFFVRGVKGFEKGFGLIKIISNNGVGGGGEGGIQILLRFHANSYSPIPATGGKLSFMAGLMVIRVFLFISGVQQIIVHQPFFHSSKRLCNNTDCHPECVQTRVERMWMFRYSC